LKLSVTGTALCAVTSLGIVAAPAASADTTRVATTASQAAPAHQPAKLSQKQRAAMTVKYAYAQIGDWYRYGGNGPKTWDCSGLAVGAWRHGGVKLPRVTTSIYRSVHKKVPWRSLRPGDLVFFYHLGHVGIYVGKGYMIHAPHTGQKVKRVKLNRYYRQQFAGAVRPGA
jgi:Cell wall-associated hydrolases (invasion-associated proteins)